LTIASGGDIFALNYFIMLRYINPKGIIFLVLFWICELPLMAQSVGIGTTTPDPNSMLDIQSTNKGLLIPRIQKINRPASPSEGMLIYQLDSFPGIYNYRNGEWRKLLDSQLDDNLVSFGPDTTVTFNYTGNVQSWVVPNGVHWVKINCKGAEGATGVFHIPNVTISYMAGGKGGESEGFLMVTPGETLHIYVGEFIASPVNGTDGQVINGGWNGGGNAKIQVIGGAIHIGAAGGGASDVRQGGMNISNRVIVAGGGGGGGSINNKFGGAGGGTNGANATCPVPADCGVGGTQTSGYALGQGESPVNGGLGAGGGGWYGGTGGIQFMGAGGGGSGYLHPQLRNVFSNQNIRSGHGIVTITYNRNTQLDTFIHLPYTLSDNSINDALNVQAYGNNALLHIKDSKINGDNAQLNYNPTTQRVGIGVTNPASKLEVKGSGGATISSTSDGVGATDWIAANIGASAGDRVVMGNLFGKATVAGHNNALSNYADLVLNPGGKILMPNLGQTGKRFVTIDQNNVLGDTSFYGFNNGVQWQQNAVQLGGNFIQPTTISNNGHDFSLNYAFSGSGGVFNQYIINSTNTFTSNVGQTFNFPYNATLTSIVYKSGFAVSSGTFYIYKGINTSGTPLRSGSISSSVATEIALPMNNLNIQKDSTYTLYFVSAFPVNELIGTWPYGSVIDPLGVPLSYDIYIKFIGIPDVPGYHALKVEGSSGKVGIGTSGNGLFPAALNVNAQNSSSSGTVNWIAANIGGQNGKRIVMGLLNGEPSLGAHNSALTAWDTLNITPGGHLKIGALAGNGNKYLSIDNNGIVSGQSIGNASTSSNGILTSADWNTFNNKQNFLFNANATTSGILTATDWNTFNNKQNALPNANTTTNGILTSTDWNAFNNKQNALPNANTSTSGILTATDWNIFNNKQNTLPNANTTTNGILTSTDWNTFNSKQNALPNANGTTNGILTSTDWNTFNNKYDLPPLTSGSILYSNGTNIVQTNNQLFFNGVTQYVGIGNNDPQAKIDIQGTKGIKVSSTNSGSGTTDWIAINAGGSAGDRVVAGILNGGAAIGAHNNATDAWDTLVVNPDATGTSIVLGGNKDKTVPDVLNNTQIAGRPVAVNGSIRQSYYAVPVSIAAGGATSFTWTHNLGYGPIVMMSTDQNGGGANMVDVSYTTYNNDTNQTVFLLKNNGSGTATGTFRWILVW
jgi:hypothetical protein